MPLSPASLAFQASSCHEQENRVLQALESSFTDGDGDGGLDGPLSSGGHPQQTISLGGDVVGEASSREDGEAPPPAQMPGTNVAFPTALTRGVAAAYGSDEDAPPRVSFSPADLEGLRLQEDYYACGASAEDEDKDVEDDNGGEFVLPPPISLSFSLDGDALGSSELLDNSSTEGGTHTAPEVGLGERLTLSIIGRPAGLLLDDEDDVQAKDKDEDEGGESAHQSSLLRAADRGAGGRDAFPAFALLVAILDESSTASAAASSSAAANTQIMAQQQHVRVLPRLMRLDGRVMAVLFRFHDNLLKDTLPALHAHFAEVGVEPQLYLVEWLFTLFTKALPRVAVAWLFDQFMLAAAHGERCAPISHAPPLPPS